MPGGKIAMRLMENPRRRSKTHARRAKGIEKKAEELVKLCGVGVAVVVAEGAAGAVPRVWESEEGVLDKYRALPPEIRAQHTLRNHLKEEICKDRAKLARVRQQGPIALADAPLDGITPAEAWELLQTIEASLSATARRLEALGLPAGGGQLEQIEADIVMPQIGHDGSNEGDIGFQIETAPCPGKRGNVGQQLEEFPRDDRLQMHNIDMPQPGFGFQGTNGNYSGVVDSYGQMQAPVYGCPGGNYSDAIDSYGQMQASSYGCPGDNYSDAVDSYGQMQAPSYGCPDGNYSGAVHNYGQMQASGYGFSSGNYLGAVDSYGQMQTPSYSYPGLTTCYGVLPIGYYYPSLGMGVGSHFINDTVAPEQSAIVASTAPPGYTIGGNCMNLESYSGYGQSLQDFQHAGISSVFGSRDKQFQQILPFSLVKLV
uniref:Uncharacterized protein n=1 Tax=Avena sativa TaxID=4498 RepID=A0ACD5YP65_AVESA